MPWKKKGAKRPLSHVGSIIDGVRKMRKLYDEASKLLPGLQYKTPLRGGESYTSTRTKTKRRSYGRRYKTSGSLSRFKKPKRKVRKDPYQCYGSVKRIEQGGVETDANAIYVGVSTMPQDQTMDAICRAIVKELCRQSGQDFQSWADGFKTAASKIQLSYRYYTSAIAITANQRNVGITLNQSFSGIAEALAADIDSVLAPQTKPIFEDFWLNTTVATGSEQVVAKVSGKDMLLDFDCFATVRIQNRTLAGTTTSEEDDDNRNDISNNPLAGKIYKCRGNAFIPQYRESGDASYESYCCDPVYGWIVANAANTNTALVVKPPPANFFKRCYKTGSVVLNPGNIKSASCRSKFSITLNNLASQFPQVVGDPTATDQIGMGHSVMIGLEKVLNSRGAENDVSVAWEVDLTFKCKARYRRNLCAAPMVQVGA